MIVEVLHAVIGLFIGLFIPGFLVTLILFKKLDFLERVALSIGFSISIDIFAGLFLGVNKTMKGLTGGLTEFNVWFILVLISTMLLLVYLIKEKLE